MRLRRPMLRAARRWFPSLNADDLEDLYQSAWLSAVRTGAEIENIDAYLYEAVRSQGLMELRRRRRRPSEPLEPLVGESDRDGGEPVGAAGEAPPDEQVEARMVARLVKDVLAELTPRQRQVAKLRWGWSLSREEIAGALGLSPRTVKRELRRASERLAVEGEVVRSGRWCERRRSLVTAYALGVLSPAQAERARLHLDACPGCRSLVLEQRHRAELLGALLPAPHAPLPDPAGWSGVGAVLEELRERATELALGAKQHLAVASARAGDPTPLAGARPGAAAFVVAGCMAAGGGTYCAVEGLPDLWRPSPAIEQRDNARTDAKPARAAQEDPAPAPPQPPPEEAPPPTPAPAPEPPPAPAPPEPSSTITETSPTTPDVVEAEFFGTAPQQAPGPSRAAPAPAPASPSGERSSEFSP